MLQYGKNTKDCTRLFGLIGKAAGRCEGEAEMKVFGGFAAVGAGLGLLVTGCGGGGGNITPPPPPPTTYTLTVDSLNPASGVAITVSPADTTGAKNGSTSFTRTYDAAAAVTLTAPATSGGNAFSSWTGCTTSSTETCNVTMNANMTVTAGYTMPPPPASNVTVNPANLGIAVTDQLLGMNAAAWYDQTTTGIVPAFQAAGIKAVRWPGGSWSDAYNWEDNFECSTTGPSAVNYANSNDTFVNFVNDLAKPAGLDVALTADYGTGENCTGYGDPAEAASWAAAALTDGITVSHMTVGNEEYGSWETDNHPVPNDAATYAAATAGSNGYYDLIKAASPQTLVGVSVNPGNVPTWDSVVLANAAGYYDFVEYHYYPEAPGSESDTFIVQQAAQQLTTTIGTIRTELATAGEPNKPIYVGEIGGTYTNPGKQSWSITQGLYAGQVLGEMMNDGVSRLTWWIGFGNCNGQAGNDTSSVYGWQNFGAYNVFSDGPTETACPDAGPLGTMSPIARAFELYSHVLVNGEHVLAPTVAGDTTDVRAYAATHSGGTALVLFNDNEATAEPVTVTLTGVSSATDVSVITYDKALYDESNPATTDTWAPPTTTDMGAQSLPLALTLNPWSMNVVIVQ